MLKHPTLDLLGQLGLAGMAKAFAEMESNDDAASLSHAEWLALLLDHEATYRNDRRLALRLRHAKLRHRAVPEDVDYRTRRSLDRRLFETLLAGEWISRHENLAIIGPTGIGKSWLNPCAGLRPKPPLDHRQSLMPSSETIWLLPGRDQIGMMAGIRLEQATGIIGIRNLPG